MKTNPNDSIQPQKYSETKGSIVYHRETTGLTKREYFAAMAMQGFLGNTRLTADYKKTAEGSLKMADALIAALNETSTSKQ